jgi:hypothetical protein
MDTPFSRLSETRGIVPRAYTDAIVRNPRTAPNSLYIDKIPVRPVTFVGEDYPEIDTGWPFNYNVPASHNFQNRLHRYKVQMSQWADRRLKLWKPVAPQQKVVAPQLPYWQVIDRPKPKLQDLRRYGPNRFLPKWAIGFGKGVWTDPDPPKPRRPPAVIVVKSSQPVVRLPPVFVSGGVSRKRRKIKPKGNKKKRKKKKTSK